MDTLLNRILWRGKSRWELILGGIGFLLGLFLFLFCIQVYTDIDSLFNRRLALEKQLDYIIISKKVDLAGLIGSGEVGFEKEEIDELSSQEFTVSVGELKTNNFAARAEVFIFGRGFITELFFEAVPDDFLDIIPEGWNWREDSPFVPVMISRDFLMLYNFGYSQARGFPLVSEDMLKLVQVKLEISGNNRYKTFNARLVGLSDRIASILVPYGFMDWANKACGSMDTKPARLIFSVKDRSDPKILHYIESHNYETSREKLRLSDAGFTIAIILGIIAFIGLLLITLSFIIFLTTFRLVISHSTPEIRLLIDLGYTKRKLISTFMIILGAVFFLIAFIDGVSITLSIGLFHNFLIENGLLITEALHPAVPAAGILFILTALAGNYVSLRLSMSRLATPRQNLTAL
jgi:hypothetical protein